MKKKLLLFCLIYLSVAAAAQEKEKNISKAFESLQLNSSPAYVVLGVDPENIQRPNSPSDFKASIHSAIVNNILQPNFALETSPYYWNKAKKDPSRFNALDYIANNNYGENLAKSITFSLATSPSDSFTFGSLQKGTGYGIGLHMQLFQGKVSNNLRENISKWFRAAIKSTLLEEIKGYIEDSDEKKISDLNEWMRKWVDEAVKDVNFITPNAAEMIAKQLVKEIGKNTLTLQDVESIAKRISVADADAQKATDVINSYTLPLTREGFILELAVANAGVAENNEWEKLSNAKTAIWLTPSYRFNVNKDPSIIDFIDLIAVVRLTFNNKAVDSSHYFDGGFKLQWLHNRLSFSAEGVIRYLTKKPDGVKKNHTLRTDISFSYKINELITFKATFGSNFNGTSVRYSDPKKMFAIGGFNFGFSNFLKSKQKDL